MGYKCEIIADSKCGDHRITTFLLTYPRIIHAEMMTHRVFSRNSASSRAIPFEKMVKMVEEDPFIPIAWQKDHKGMQGTEYLDETVEYDLVSFMTILNDTLSNTNDEKERLKLEKRIKEKTQIIQELLSSYTHLRKTLPEWWLFARDKAIEAASILYVFDVTKQLCNRLLEPFMWHTVLITATEWENFFELRCPKYQTPVSQTVEPQRSWKDLLNVHSNPINQKLIEDNKENWTFKMQHSLSQAEIHIQAIAEMMWDAYCVSTPKILKPGEWHIPFGDKIENIPETIWEACGYNENNALFADTSTLQLSHIYEKIKIKIAVARCARLSYMTFDGEIDYSKDIKLYDTLLKSKHFSPFEHSAKAMVTDELVAFTKNGENGWCDNFRGFVPYRYMIGGYNNQNV